MLSVGTLPSGAGFASLELAQLTELNFPGLRALSFGVGTGH